MCICITFGVYYILLVVLKPYKEPRVNVYFRKAEMMFMIALVFLWILGKY